jgi:hypothetical protein
MTSSQADYTDVVRCRMAEEESVQQKTDSEGKKWRKAYFGGGAHYQGWLEQFQEVYGQDRIMVEEADASGLQCYQEGGEKMYRIWVKDED